MQERKGNRKYDKQFKEEAVRLWSSPVLVDTHLLLLPVNS